MINNTQPINRYLTILIFILCSFSYSQNTISRVDFEIIDNDKVEMFIYYTLIPEDSKDFYFIDLKISSDGGDNWFSPKSIQGDIDLQSGHGNRKIIWDIFSDMEIQYRINEIKYVANNDPSKYYIQSTVILKNSGN